MKNQTSDFKLQQDFLKFSDICVSWNSPKTDLETNILNLKNRSFEVAVFVQYELFKSMFDIPVLINLFISLIDLKNIH